jgi:hypothetical protein
MWFRPVYATPFFLLCFKFIAISHLSLPQARAIREPGIDNIHVGTKKPSNSSITGSAITDNL